MTKDVGWWQGLIGKKVVVAIDPADSAGSAVLSSTTLPEPSGVRKGAAPYARGVPVSRYKSIGRSESARVFPEEAPSAVRAAAAMLSLMVPDNTYGTHIRHTLRFEERGAGSWISTWHVTAGFAVDWSSRAGVKVQAQWMWRTNEWTRASVLEVDRDPSGRFHEKQWWTNQISVETSNDMRYHLWSLAGMIEFLADAERESGSGLV